MAKNKKKVEVEDDDETTEDDDLEDLGDLEDLADEADDADEEDEDDEEDTKKSKKSKSKTKAAKKESDSIGTAELAEALDTDGKNLRVMLRDRKVKKNENNRYEWESVDAALTAMKFDDLDEAQEALAESRNKRLDALKARNAKKKAETADVEDDDDDEPEPAPKKKKKKAKK